MQDIVRVNDRIVKRVGRVDVKVVLAERMLEGGLDSDELGLTCADMGVNRR